MKSSSKKMANGSTRSIPKNAVVGRGPNQLNASEKANSVGTIKPASAVAHTTVRRRVRRSSPSTRKPRSTTASSGESIQICVALIIDSMGALLPA